MFKWWKKPDWREHPEYQRIERWCNEEIAQCSAVLLCCPFCGSDPAISFKITEAGYAGTVFYDWGFDFFVSCSRRHVECEVGPCTNGEPELEWVIEHWNKRAGGAAAVLTTSSVNIVATGTTAETLYATVNADA